VRTGTAVSELSRQGNAYRLSVVGAADIEVDAVALATPDMVTARLLGPLAPDVADELATVEYASVVMVAFVFDRSAVSHPLDGSGFLVAEAEGLLMTACSWASSKWAHLSSDDHVVLRVSTGRHHDRRALHLDDGALVDALLADLRTTMGVVGTPAEVRVTRWTDGLPQFRPGHLDRVTRWRTALSAETPGLVVGGAGFDGLGVPACVRQGRQMAATLLGPMER
jgi:oxygen-dependent protoporphyrinogen oxidase